jgi:hypothetical protein
MTNMSEDPAGEPLLGNASDELPELIPSLVPQQRRGSWRLTVLNTGLGLLAGFVIALLFFNSGSTGPGPRLLYPDPFHGKTLTPTNYTVVQGIFIQDDPNFESSGYDLLTDSFGLIDKSTKRWRNLTEYAEIGHRIGLH